MNLPKKLTIAAGYLGSCSLILLAGVTALILFIYAPGLGFVDEVKSALSKVFWFSFSVGFLTLGLLWWKTR